MTRYFRLREDRTAVTADLDASHRWGLPGVRCHTCGTTWASSGHQYPAVDLSPLPERHAFEKPRTEPFPEFARLRELVRPLLPPDAALPPGTLFGPLDGNATGRFGPLTSQGEILWVARKDALDQLQTAGVRGLVGCPTALRFRQKSPPELLELQLEAHGRLHPDCLPPDLQPPCETCGRVYFRLPDDPVLDAASLPRELDLFRVGNYATMIVATDRFMEAAKRLEPSGVTFRELPVR
ncbi:double-CXXCG motif protein [Myxococcus sp. K15C18031901]|uniref:SitI6 family double-CXXCG motif immunity protein n=1 Tax=Myxococcus dinghuensis TaxID=2906761 RepID=UPI0020A81196|nr:double-CXXCG motif protein [Myxococcus dinghuensis]MCP3100949.1 double-CXXCG motif protein [Myxococcus dinghuensis]